jgi:alpha-galactosidase
MQRALNLTNHPILFSLCEWGVEDPATWAPQVGNSWRTTGDISDSWGSMTSNLDQNDRWWKQAAPGGWNDPDMLEVGNGGMTNDEYVAHFSLWALIKSPLLIGCDVTAMSNATLSILTNKDIIALNQDPLGVQGHRVAKSNDLEVWAGPLANGDVAVILFNRSPSAANITAQWADIGLAKGTAATARDLWSKANLGSFTDSLQLAVPTHAVRTLRLTPAKQPTVDKSTASQ